MKFVSKNAIFGVIWGDFEGFGPCLGISHPFNFSLKFQLNFSLKFQGAICDCSGLQPWVKKKQLNCISKVFIQRKREGDFL